jgi:hypothetical protein
MFNTEDEEASESGKKLLKNLLPLNQLKPNLEELVLGWSSL